MAEHWDLKISDEREADQIAAYIIFCEDENSEPFYFSSFEIGGRLKINTIPNQKQHKLNLNNTIAHCKADGLIVFEDDGYKFNIQREENIWCVYDRDIAHPDFDQIKQEDHIDFDTAIQTANAAGLNVAWSNDAFELWILLHFEMVPIGEMFHRNYIYDRLTAIFRSLNPECIAFQAIVANPYFNYKNSFKRRVNFIQHVIPLLHPRTNIALQHAEILEAAYNENTPFHARNPGTTVHKLIQLLISHHQ